MSRYRAPEHGNMYLATPINNPKNLQRKLNRQFRARKATAELLTDPTLLADIAEGRAESPEERSKPLTF